VPRSVTWIYGLGLGNYECNLNGNMNRQVQIGASGVDNGILLNCVSRQQGVRLLAVKYGQTSEFLKILLSTRSM
jgi:hypothetical protein